jgi:hypothetical protein
VIRFRFTEDEKRYLLLIGEAYRLVAASLPAPAVSRVMRNLGKAQDMLMLEGMRQGLAVAEISRHAAQAGDASAVNAKAFQAHSMIYGSADTPLRDMELEWLQRFGLPADTSERTWLDGKPMRFAPQTLRAYEAEQAAPRANFAVEAATPHLDQATWPGKEQDEGAPEPARSEERADVPEGENLQERPALLDQARDALQKLVGEGYQPGSWSEMIMRLHLIMKVDAGFLDLQMGTEMGRTVLAQCGIHDIIPGRGIDLNEMQKTLDDPEAVLALSGDSTET